MAAQRSPEQVVQDIAELSRTATTKVVRLSPAVRGGFVRLIGAARHRSAVVAAVDQYLLASRRVESHADPAALAVFTRADAVLTQQLATVTGPDMDLLRRELAQRRATVLLDPAALEERLRVAAERQRRRLRARPGPDGADLHAALLQQRFFQRLRDVAARGPAGWTSEQRSLLRGYRKLRAVLGSQWADGWETTFRHLRENAVGIAGAGRELRSAVSALDEARAGGSAVLVRAAEARVQRARRRAHGHLSRIKGHLGEAYVPRWSAWQIQVDGFLDLARREVARRPGHWEVRRVTGDLRIGGRQAWDEAVLLVRRDVSPPSAELFLAAQFKVEKRVSALRQVHDDARRETALVRHTAPVVLSFRSGDAIENVVLSPPGAGTASHRYVFNAAGGRFSAADVARLRQAGLDVNQLSLDVSVGEFDAVAEALMDVVSATVGR